MGAEAGAERARRKKTADVTPGGKAVGRRWHLIGYIFPLAAPKKEIAVKGKNLQPLLFFPVFELLPNDSLKRPF